ECIHSACPHYHRCFIERSVRKARRARIVVANHALVMIQAALGGLDDAYLPNRYVFDEGHHVFDAADSAFSLALSGQETADLRRWLIGVEAGGRGRARGLRRRIGDLVAGDDAAEKALADALLAARALPGRAGPPRLFPPPFAVRSPPARASATAAMRSSPMPARRSPSSCPPPPRSRRRSPASPRRSRGLARSLARGSRTRRRSSTAR